MGEWVLYSRSRARAATRQRDEHAELSAHSGSGGGAEAEAENGETRQQMIRASHASERVHQGITSQRRDGTS